MERFALTDNRLSRLLMFFTVLAAAILLVLPDGNAFAYRHYCLECNMVTNGTLEYDPVDGFYQPTCTKAGWAMWHCTNCDVFYDEITVPALGHSYVVTTTDATCEEAGKTVHRCKRCGYSYTDEIAALGHDMVLTEDVPPTCTEPGRTVLSCTRCEKEEVTEAAAFGHFFLPAEGVQPTCLEAGESVKACLRCGEEEHTELAALGHSWGAWTTEVEPTSFKDGLEARSCVRCSLREERVMDRLPLTGTPAGTGVIVGGALVLLGVLGFAAKKILAARAAVQTLAGAEHGFEAFKLTEKKVLAKLDMAQASNEAFVALLKSKPNLSITLMEPSDDTGLASKIEELDPDALLMDFAGLDGLAEAEAAIAEASGAKENLKVELIAAFADDGVRARLEELKEAGTIARYAFGTDNRYVKLTKLIVPLYKDMMKDADSVEAMGIIAEMFGIPVVPEVLGVLANAEHAGEIAEVVKDKFNGVELEASDGLTVINALGEILGLDGIAAGAELLEDLGDTKETVQSDEEGNVHKAYKGAEVAKDVGDVIGSLLG